MPANTVSSTSTAALALEAADRQGKIWAMHDALALRRGDVDERSVCEVAEAIGLDVRRLRRRMSSGADAPKVEDDSFDIEALSEDGSPVVYLNGQRMHGLINRWTISEQVTALLGGAAREETQAQPDEREQRPVRQRSAICWPPSGPSPHQSFCHHSAALGSSTASQGGR